MNAKEAIAIARKYIEDVYEGEGVTNLGLEEVEHEEAHQKWIVCLAFSRPWNTPRSRAQEVLEGLGAVSSLKRSYKVLTITEGGDVLSMKSRQRADALD